MITTINEYKYELTTYRQQIAKYVFDSEQFKVIDISVKKVFMEWVESDFKDEIQWKLTHTILKVYKNLPNDVRRVNKDLKILDIINGKILENKNNQMIKESIGDISLEEIRNEKFNEIFPELLSSLYKKEPTTTADWAGIDAWKISGETWKGYFVIKDENNYSDYRVSYSFIYRYDDEDNTTQSDVITYLESSEQQEVKDFLNILKKYKI
jgi:hypothetical protein